MELCSCLLELEDLRMLQTPLDRGRRRRMLMKFGMQVQGMMLDLRSEFGDIRTVGSRDMGVVRSRSGI